VYAHINDAPEGFCLTSFNSFDFLPSSCQDPRVTSFHGSGSGSRPHLTIHEFLNGCTTPPILATVVSSVRTHSAPSAWRFRGILSLCFVFGTRLAKDHRKGMVNIEM